MRTGKIFLIFLALLILTLTANIILDNWHYKEGDHRRLQKEISKKFQRTDRICQKLMQNNWLLGTTLPGDRDITLIAFRDDSLIYWSDNTLPLSSLKEQEVTGKHFEFISNGWYVIKPYLSDSIRAYGLILIKTQYPYENDFLVNGFQPDLKLPTSTQILTEPEPGSFSILDWEGIYLFSIKFSVHELRFARLEKYLIPGLILISLLAFLMLMHSILERIRKPLVKDAALGMIIIILVGLRWIQYRFHVPYDLYDLDLFGPVPFAKSDLLPSLGDVFLNSFLILFLVSEFCLWFKFPRSFFKTGKSGINTATLVMMMLLTGYYVFTHIILSNLILHSTINFEFYKAASLSAYTLIGLLIAAMHFGALLLLTYNLLALAPRSFSLIKFILMFMLVSAVILVVAYLLDYGFDYGSYLAFILMFIVLAMMHFRNIPVGNYTAMAFMVIFFSAYSVFLFTHFARQKMASNMKVMAENLANQHDPVAEYLLEDISNRIRKDVIFKNYMFNRNISYEQIFKYLKSNYFNGFWGKYSLNIIDCDPYTNVILDDSVPAQQMNCYAFYKDLLSKGSMQLPRTDFYFLDSQNGQINYLGWLTYERPGSREEFTFFIELTSRLVAEELGFPDLLLDKKYHKNRLLEEYSFASYYKNKLVAQSGTFQYSLDLLTYENSPEKFEGYNHLIYHINNDSAVMVSRPAATFFDKLVSFSYIFLFYYFLVLIYVTIRNFSELGKDITFNFKNKIQLSIIAILFLSLILVGGGTIYFSIQQYQRKQHDLLSEKIQSVYIELDHLLAYLPNRISPSWKGDDYDNLNQLLIKFSDVFYSDINLFDPRGDLLASSRTELFDQGILGRKMNPQAYNKMVREKQAEFIHRENIGKLSYLSAYVPFVNAKNKLLAYLNLPYFTKQNVLRSDVTTLVVAVVNIYVLLILLTIAMAVIISDQITRPLRMIQQKFSEIKIGKKNEEIVYTGHDEIAGLVGEYNRMVKELVKSVEMLSRSERESAWREMAKQIAHEIKNPLTPMKLSVQYLLRSWKDNKENFDEYLEKVTRTLIEQIDNLSFIASEFSNFAKMPKAFNEEINIVDKIRSTLTLFSNTENVDFIFEHESEGILVYADKEQLSRVFINLLKNAIQSIPEARHGKVGISLVLNGSMVRISITDNGKGIPEELQNKLFTPSFTTKSSGMGLGLSIVKNIIESFGGHITFKTKVNHGTTFIFELPVYMKAAVGGPGH
jgi:two-component system, NtrC family, nitrogen regulation sensor histidine kinase NtrY